MPMIGGISFGHVDIEGGFLGLYQQDFLDLSDIGLDILIWVCSTVVRRLQVWDRPGIWLRQSPSFLGTLL